MICWDAELVDDSEAIDGWEALEFGILVGGTSDSDMNKKKKKKLREEAALIPC